MKVFGLRLKGWPPGYSLQTHKSIHLLQMPHETRVLPITYTKNQVRKMAWEHYLT